MDLNDDENLGNVSKAIGRRRSMEDPVLGRLPQSLDGLIGDLKDFRKLGIVSNNLRIGESVGCFFEF